MLRNYTFRAQRATEVWCFLAFCPHVEWDQEQNGSGHTKSSSDTSQPSAPLWLVRLRGQKYCRARSHTADEQRFILLWLYKKSCMFLHVTKNAQTQGGAGKIKDASYYLSSTSQPERLFWFWFFAQFSCSALTQEAEHWAQRVCCSLRLI